MKCGGQKVGENAIKASIQFNCPQPSPPTKKKEKKKKKKITQFNPMEDPLGPSLFNAPSHISRSSRVAFWTSKYSTHVLIILSLTHLMNQNNRTFCPWATLGHISFPLRTSSFIRITFSVPKLTFLHPKQIFHSIITREAPEFDPSIGVAQTGPLT